MSHWEWTHKKKKGREGGKIGRELVTAGQRRGLHRCLETTAAGVHVVEIDWCAPAVPWSPVQNRLVSQSLCAAREAQAWRGVWQPLCLRGRNLCPQMTHNDLLIETPLLNVTAIRKLHGSLMCLAYFLHFIHGCLYNQILADVQSTGAGLQYVINECL